MNHKPWTNMLKVAKVVGLNSDNEAALALVSEKPPLSLFIILQASLDDAFSRLRQALSEAENIFSTSLQPPSVRLAEILEGIKNFLSEISPLQIILAAVFEDEKGAVLYLLCQGETLKAFIQRGEKRIDLGGMSQGEVVSGVLEEEDRVFMVTQNLPDLLGKDFENLSQLPIESLEEEVASHFPQAEVSPAAMIVLEKEREVPREESFPGQESLKIRPPAKLALPKIKPPSPRGIAFLVLGLSLVILGGGIFLFRSQREKASTAAFSQSLRAASEQFSQAKTLKDSDQRQAAKSLEQAKKEVSRALEVKPQDKEAQELKKQIEEGSGEILKVFSAADFPLWLDLDLIKKGLQAKNMSLSHGKILILDEKMKVLTIISLESKSQEILAGGEKLGEASLASLNGDIAWVFSKNKGLVKINVLGKELSNPIKEDKDWGEILDLYGFAGNVYLLDKRQVWKYIPTASGYSNKREYLKSGVKADFSGVKRMQIDSSIWILKGGGEILKYTQGSPDYFAFEGLDKPVGEITSFFISDQTDNLYLLDSGNSRLLVLDKKGGYRAQYQGEKFKNFSDLVVDEKGKKAYLLENGKLFQMDLK